MAKTIQVTFEAGNETKTYPAKKVEYLHDYHGGQVGKYENKRTEFRVYAPTSPLDFEYMLSKVRQ